MQVLIDTKHLDILNFLDISFSKVQLCFLVLTKKSLSVNDLHSLETLIFAFIYFKN